MRAHRTIAVIRAALVTLASIPAIVHRATKQMDILHVRKAHQMATTEAQHRHIAAMATMIVVKARAIVLDRIVTSETIHATEMDIRRAREIVRVITVDNSMVLRDAITCVITAATDRAALIVEVTTAFVQ